MSIYTQSISLEPRLWVAPKPFMDESPASWVQRVSGEHQYSLSHLSEITGIKPVRNDWDIHVPNDQWSRLLHIASQEEHACGEGRFAMNTIRARRTSLKHLLYSAYGPKYRWCSTCFSYDEIPYLRWEWRLLGVTHCRVHGRRLKEFCRWCNSPLTVHRALLVSSGSSIGNARLSECGTCGMQLIDEEDEVEPRAKNEEREDSALANEVKRLVDRMRYAYWHDEDQMKFDFPEIEKETESGGPVWIDLRINRLPTFTRELLPDSKWLSLCEVGCNGTDKPARWTDGIRPADRKRLAQALLLIRKEKKAIRVEDMQEESSHQNGCAER